MNDKYQNNNLIVKSNYLIEASYKLTVQEVRVVLLLASMINKDDDKFKLYKVKVKDFIEFAGIIDT